MRVGGVLKFGEAAFMLVRLYNSNSEDSLYTKNEASRQPTGFICMINHRTLEQALNLAWRSAVARRNIQGGILEEEISRAQ